MSKEIMYYNVKNRSAGMVKYNIPEKNIHRQFQPGEIKRLPYEELLSLSQQAGGRELMANFLLIQSEGVPKSLGIRTEPEYYLTEPQIVELMTNGSLDAFLDCLDYAPVGVIELIKKYAVALPLADFQKRQALLKKTGFDTDLAVANSGQELSESQEEEAKKAEAVPSGRRTTPNYNVIKKG